MSLSKFQYRKFIIFTLVITSFLFPVVFSTESGFDRVTVGANTHIQPAEPFDPVTGTGQIVPDCGETQMCGFCDLLRLGKNVMNFLIYLAIIVAVLLFVHAGVLLLVGGSSESKRTQAKKIFSSVVIGLVLTLAAWLIVNLIMMTFLKADFGVWTLPGC